MVKFLKTFFRSKRDLEVALEISLAKWSELERRLKAAQVLNKTLQQANDAQSDAIATLQRDLAAAHAKILIQEETPPETLHGAGKGIRKSPVHLSEFARDEVYFCWLIGIPSQRIAKDYEISERTLRRIVKEARGRNS